MKTPWTHVANVALAAEAALARRDASFLCVRFDRPAPAEKACLRAISGLGEQPHRLGEIAQALGAPVTSVAPTRDSLIRKGMVYSLGYGDTVFTVPFIDSSIRRIVSLGEQ